MIIQIVANGRQQRRFRNSSMIIVSNVVHPMRFRLIFRCHGRVQFQTVPKGYDRILTTMEYHDGTSNGANLVNVGKLVSRQGESKIHDYAIDRCKGRM